MPPRLLNGKTIVTLLLVFFVVTPVIAWFITPRSNPEANRTHQEFTQLIDKHNETSADQDKIPSVTVQSSRRVQDVWYVVNVTAPDSSTKGVMVVADFQHDPEKMEIITKPFEPLFYKNVSLIGMPYDVIDEVNASLEGGTDNE